MAAARSLMIKKTTKPPVAIILANPSSMTPRKAGPAAIKLSMTGMSLKNYPLAPWELIRMLRLRKGINSSSQALSVMRKKPSKSKKLGLSFKTSTSITNVKFQHYAEQ